jgi:hypothetical protein
MKTLHSCLLLVTALALGLLAHTASAQTATWNAATGFWSNALNWNPAVVPNGPSFDVIFNNGGSLMLDGSPNFGSYSQTGGTLTVLGVQGLVVSTNGNSGTLDGGGVIKLGYSYIYEGAANVVFTNTNGTIQGYGEVGFNGLSVLNQPAGIIQANTSGQALFLNGSGTFTNNGLMRAVSGGRLSFQGASGATFINNATIRSENVSAVEFQQCTLVGGTLDNAASTGILTTNDGTLRDVTIAAGSTVTNNNGRIDNTLINHGTLSSPNSILVADDTTLSGGGTIALGYGLLYATSSDLTLTNTDNIVRGYGEIGFANNNFSVINASGGVIQGDSGGQTLQLNGGGTFTNQGLMRAMNGGALTFDGSAGATVTNDGGTVQVLTGSAINGVQLALTQNSGTIDLDGGAMYFPLGLDLNGGQLIGNGTFTGPIRNNGGIVGPGHSAGRITENGTYSQGANGTLNIELGGTVAATEFDQLQVNGPATLGGTLALSFINGFENTVQNTDTFVILTADQILAGAFDNVASGARLITSDGLASFQVDYAGTVVTLSNFQPALELQLTAAVSRKTHGASGDFDLPLILSPAGNGTVEPRANGPTTIVFTFNSDIVAADGTISSNEFTIANASFSSASISGNELTLNLTGVVDQSVVSIALNGINSTGGTPLSGDNDVEIRALLADANQDRAVGRPDLMLLRQHKGQSVNSTNFVLDLDLDGLIGKGDNRLVVQNRSHTVP